MQNRLKVLRRQQGWSQAQLAERLAISRQAFNAIETGKHDPSLRHAFRIARLFNRTVADIFDDRSSPS
ncbi:helix-turn-helix transcriptional regulator [Sphingomonas sp. 2R-10]|uniref:helix-turn-helix transcriptional regulator n=1 Tax=Sphingomonas sp. 2R-10 TaxID=3045148 RepID=UPI0024B9E309|nr:helix-turn-helix transcriptional regulator [Sphingomonas sp. 2R-10]MDJ0277652.1 helix-turn-helix transcriptional regulator [Sphingomonas sp. 2R-10]